MVNFFTFRQRGFRAIVAVAIFSLINVLYSANTFATEETVTTSTPSDVVAAKGIKASAKTPVAQTDDSFAINPSETKSSTKTSTQESTETKIHTPTVGKHISSDMDLFSMLTSLLIVIGIIFFAAIILKRFQLHQPVSGGLKVISTLPLGTKERLVVIQAGEKQVVVGVTPNSINLITELDEPLSKAGSVQKITASNTVTATSSPLSDMFKKAFFKR